MHKRQVERVGAFNRSQLWELAEGADLALAAGFAWMFPVSDGSIAKQLVQRRNHLGFAGGKEGVHLLLHRKVVAFCPAGLRPGLRRLVGARNSSWTHQGPERSAFHLSIDHEVGLEPISGFVGARQVLVDQPRIPAADHQRVRVATAFAASSTTKVSMSTLPALGKMACSNSAATPDAISKDNAKGALPAAVANAAARW